MTLPAPEEQRSRGWDGELTALLCLYHTQQLLPAVAALLAYRETKKQDADGPAMALVWSTPFTPERIFDRRRAAFERLLHGFPWLKLWMPEPGEIARHLSHNQRVGTKAAWLCKKFSGQGFSEILYAQDVGDDFTAQSLVQAFPCARRICFGDALGVFYTHAYFESLIYPWGRPAQWRRAPRKYFGHFMMRLRRAWLLPLPGRRLHPQFAIPILGCDPGGDFLAGKTVHAVPAAVTRQVLRSMTIAAERGHVASSIAFVMLLGSYSESKLCSLEQELGLYQAALARHAPAGTRVLLKPHPVSTREKIARITEALRLTHDVEVVDENLFEIPIEAMSWLFDGRRVLSFSYSSVSLKLLFNAHVIHAMDETMISDFFYPATQDWMRDSNQLYVEQFDAARRVRENQFNVIE